MRALGLDYGTKSLGIAITDSMKIVASPVENFFYSDGKLETILNKVKQVFKKYNNDIDVIVLGYPLFPSGDKCANSYAVEKFKALLEQEFTKVRVVLEDERNTTSDAIDGLRQCGAMKKTIKNKKDVIAAVIILQQWLQWPR